jgi:hypothetical protein
LWKKAAPGAGVTVLLGLFGVWAVGFSSPATSTTVTVVSASPEVGPSRLARASGEAVALPSGVQRPPSGGVRLELEPGEYVLTTTTGSQVRFRVPDQTFVLLGGSAEDYGRALARELDVN